MTQSIINGIVLGGAYALVAIGFVVLFNNTQFFNFAHGDFLTLGAFLGYSFVVTLRLAWPLAVVLIVIVMTAVGLLTELLTRRVVSKRALLIGAIATLGLGLVIRAVIQMIWGPVDLNLPPLVDKPAIQIFGAALSYQQLIILAFTLVVLAGLWWMYQHTFIGLVMKATAEDPTAAQIMGVRTSLVIRGSFVGSAVLAGVAGFLVAPSFSVSLLLGYLIVFKAIVGSFVGGFGSLVGAVVGCIIVGIAEVLASYYLSADFRNIAVYGLLIVLFVVRPIGIFGTKLMEKV